MKQIGYFTFDKVLSLTKKSQKFIDSYQKTMDGLSKTNEEIVEERARKAAQIKKLADEDNDLAALMIKNANIVTKMQSFLS